MAIIFNKYFFALKNYPFKISLWKNENFNKNPLKYHIIDQNISTKPSVRNIEFDLIEPTNCIFT